MSLRKQQTCDVLKSNCDPDKSSGLCLRQLPLFKPSLSRGSPRSGDRRAIGARCCAPSECYDEALELVHKVRVPLAPRVSLEPANRFLPALSLVTWSLWTGWMLLIALKQRVQLMRKLMQWCRAHQVQQKLQHWLVLKTSSLARSVAGDHAHSTNHLAVAAGSISCAACRPCSLASKLLLAPACSDIRWWEAHAQC